MRAICETCAQVQPPDWQPGDLCGNCGTVVRRENRCYWCVALTPAGKFCRSCGAGQVPAGQYGAARWLKHLGADQFAIPDRLATIDPEQLEHFERLYQAHAAVAERHLDDLALAESLARQRGWTQTLEAELLPRLPLPPAELQALALPPRRGTTEAEQLAEIRDSTPFATTRTLVALARLRLWQTRDALTRADITPDLQALDGPVLPDALAIEHGLTLSHWRLSMAPFGLHFQRQTDDGRWAAQALFPLEAAVNTALFKVASDGKPQPVPAEALAAEDPDLAFAAALAAQVPEPLLAALRVPARRYVAAYVLTRMGVDFALAPLLPGFAEEEVDRLLHTIHWQQRPRPDLRPLLQTLAAGGYGGPALRSGFVRQARELLVLDLRPGDALALAAAHPEMSFILKILNSPALDPTELVALARELVARDALPVRELSPEVLARLPPDFVASAWRTAPPNALQGLRQLAGQQLDTYDRREALTLHTFLRAVLWDEAAAPEARTQAWHVLQHWYQGYGHPSGLRLALEPAAATAYFGGFAPYVEYFVYGLEHLAVLQALDVEGDFLRPLETAAEPTDAPALLAALAALPLPLVMRLRRALVALARDYAGWAMPRHWAVQVLGRLLGHAPWAAGVRAELQSLQNTPDEQVAYLVEQTLAQ